MEKMNIGIYCYLISDILTKLLQKCSFSGPLSNHTFLLLPLTLIGYHGNRKAKCAKTIIRNQLSRSYGGIKLKLCKIFSNISLYKNVVLLSLLKHFGCYHGNFKWQKWKLRFIAISLQIFWRKFYRNVCWMVLHNAYHFSLNLSIWLVAMATEMLNLRKNIFKTQLLRSYNGDKAETLQNCS